MKKKKQTMFSELKVRFPNSQLGISLLSELYIRIVSLKAADSSTRILLQKMIPRIHVFPSLHTKQVAGRWEQQACLGNEGLKAGMA